jgi:hypothetical protein
MTCHIPSQVAVERTRPAFEWPFAPSQPLATTRARTYVSPFGSSATTRASYLSGVCTNSAKRVRSRALAVKGHWRFWLGNGRDCLGRWPNERCRKFSVSAWEDEFEQLWLHRHEARAPVEAPSLLVALLDDDLERSRPLRDRIPLCISAHSPGPLCASATAFANRFEREGPNSTRSRRPIETDLSS